VKVVRGEGYARIPAPKPCAVDCEVGGEAWAGGGMGQPLSRERLMIPGAQRLQCAVQLLDRRFAA